MRQIALRYSVPRILTSLAALALLVAPAAAQMKGLAQPPRGIASGHVQSASNGMLTITTDSPAYNVPLGTKLEFVLGPQTMIFGPRSRAAASDIQNYQRATVQYAQQGNRRVAVHIRLFQPVHAPSPQPPPILVAQQHINRGLALQSKHDLAGASTEYRAAISLAPDYTPEAHNNLGTILDAQGKHDEAIQEYRAAIRSLPNFARAHANLANTLNWKGDRAGAARENDLACQYDPATFCPQQSQGTDPGIHAIHPLRRPSHDQNGNPITWDSNGQSHPKYPQ